jgi:CRP-like cAMP-binding protein
VEPTAIDLGDFISCTELSDSAFTDSLSASSIAARIHTSTFLSRLLLVASRYARGTQLVSQGTLYSLASGQHIIEEGAEQDHLFLILEGIFDVFTKQKGNRTAVATIPAGGTLGEVNVFNPSTASAEVISRGEGRVWGIDRFGLNAFVEGNPQAGNVVLVSLLTLMSERLRVSNSKLAESNQWGGLR